MCVCAHVCVNPCASGYMHGVCVCVFAHTCVFVCVQCSVRNQSVSPRSEGSLVCLIRSLQGTVRRQREGGQGCAVLVWTLFYTPMHRHMLHTQTHTCAHTLTKPQTQLNVNVYDVISCLLHQCFIVSGRSGGNCCWSSPRLLLFVVSDKFWMSSERKQCCKHGVRLQSENSLRYKDRLI